MKTFRIVGSFFVVLGFVFALLGVLTSLFPMIENEQFKLILNSLQETSADPLTNTLNTIVRFCVHSSYFLLFCGISLMVVGGLISSAAHKKQVTHKMETAARPMNYSEPKSFGTPMPAYYPGGMEPLPLSVNADAAYDEPFLTDPVPNEPVPAVLHPNTPISGGIEPSFTADEFDAQKLMRQDKEKTAQTVQQPAVRYPEYPSNSAAEDERQRDSAVVLPREFQSPPTAGRNKPKIISTMGKRKQ